MELYRQIALLTDMTSENEVLDVACGKGVSLEYFVREFEVVGSGVDIDASLVEQAEARSRDLGMAERLQFQIGRSDELPYRDEIFDVAVGEMGGFVVLVQLVWKAPVEEERQDVLVEHLGARPRMVVEWKRFLREAAVEEVHTEDWSDQETSFRSAVAKPFPDFAELFSLPEKIGIVRRAWRQWGWRGVYTVLGRERAVHRLLTRERILGLDLLKGRKAGEMQGTGEEKRDAAIVGQGREGMRTAPEEEGLVQEDRLETSGDRGGGPRPDGEAQDHEGPRATETAGLPLFGEGAPDSPSRD
jgi:SAM-dependent methyltransferase